MSLEDDVRWLRDRELIRDLPQVYAHGIDTRDWKKVRSVFDDACHVDGMMGSLPIDAYLEKLRPGVEAYPATLHFMGNQYVRIEGDRGHVETYAVAYHMEAEGSPHPDLVMGVRYLDDTVRCGDAWRIARRATIRQWHRGPFPRPV
jgi:hypothetical protein